MPVVAGTPAALVAAGAGFDPLGGHRGAGVAEERGELAVYLVVNGPLGMSAGKIAAQAFQAAQRLYAAARAPGACPDQLAALARWEAEGTRTITRLAETGHVFGRVVSEVPGVVMVDEGLTEVEPGSATVFASWPLPYGHPPRALRHRRCPLLRAPARG